MKMGGTGINFEESATTVGAAHEGGQITVCVRKRPAGCHKDSIKIDGNQITILENKQSYASETFQHSYIFRFDHCFCESTTNDQIFTRAVRDCVDFAINGGASSIVAYGQTGTGKTFTLLEQNTGMLFQILKYLLSINRRGVLSFLEIYKGSVQDCLRDNKKINIFEKDGEIYVSEMMERPFSTLEGAIRTLETGISSRTTAVTGTNSVSSRSHAIIVIDLSTADTHEAAVKTRKLSAGNCIVVVDLAGSERGCDRRECTKDTAAEGAEINKSLLALKECIRGIEIKSKFLPFRQSKLTQVLKNSLIGNSKTCFIATVSPNDKDIEHTLNTLRYANRIKENGAGADKKSTVIDFDVSLMSENSYNSLIFDNGEAKSRSEMANVFQSKCKISERPVIRSATVSLQKSKIETLMKQLATRVEAETNLQTLKMVTAELERLVSDIKRK